MPAILPPSNLDRYESTTTPAIPRGDRQRIADELSRRPGTTEDPKWHRCRTGAKLEPTNVIKADPLARPDAGTIL